MKKKNLGKMGQQLEKELKNKEEREKKIGIKMKKTFVEKGKYKQKTKRKIAEKK